MGGLVTEWLWPYKLQPTRFFFKLQMALYRKQGHGLITGVIRYYIFSISQLFEHRTRIQEMPKIMNLEVRLKRNMLIIKSNLTDLLNQLQ